MLHDGRPVACISFPHLALFVVGTEMCVGLSGELIAFAVCETAVPEVTGTEGYIESSFNFTILSPVLCGLWKQCDSLNICH